MNSFAVLILCIQACLVQSIFGQCLGSYGGIGAAGLAPYGYAGYANYGYAGYADYGYPAGAYDVDAYGGIGEGNVAVAGELPVAGTTAVAGQVPIMGAVRFGGDVAAGGSVSIAGKCACGCGDFGYGYRHGLCSPYLY